MPYIMLMSTALHGTQPSYAPLGVSDLDADYSPFLHKTREAAEAEIAGDDTSFGHDDGAWVEACSIDVDGSIRLHDSDITLSPAALYDAFAMPLMTTPTPSA